MPKIRIELRSQRGRRLDDLIKRFLFEGKGMGLQRDLSMVPPSSKQLTVDAAPGTYHLQVEIEGFHLCWKTVRVRSAKKRPKVPIPVVIRAEHRCTDLPTWSELSQWQQRMLARSAGQLGGRKAWEKLADNQACSFFQITYALERTPMGKGMLLSDYVQRVQRIGGAEIVGKTPEGRTEHSVGWRLHVTIKPSRRASIGRELARNGFHRDEGFVHPTHARFGYTRSFRQVGPNPRLQLVLRADGSGADVDLDQGAFHLSSPKDVYGSLKRKFPAVARIYQVK